MSRFPVSRAKQEQLARLMQKLGVRSSDFEESFVRSQGKGGQNVNKVSSCVMLRHVPTGIAVKCQEERSRALNRFLARRLILRKIEQRLLGEESEEARRIYKLRRQKRKRSKRAQLKVLEAKRRHSLKKLGRRPIHPKNLHED